MASRATDAIDAMAHLSLIGHKRAVIHFLSMMRRPLVSLLLIAASASRRAPGAKALLLHPPPQHHGPLLVNNHSSVRLFMAKPKRGSVVDSYQTVSVNCQKCGERLFRYKKKNGTKSNLVKCYVERISEDSAGLLAKNRDNQASEEQGFLWHCPSCDANFARSAKIHGRPALKMVGGKVRMTKK